MKYFWIDWNSKPWKLLQKTNAEYVLLAVLKDMRGPDGGPVAAVVGFGNDVEYLKTASELHESTCDTSHRVKAYMIYERAALEIAGFKGQIGQQNEKLN